MPAGGSRIQRGARRPVAVGIGVEDLLGLRLDHPGHHRLRHPVRYGGDGRFILPLLQSRAGRTLVFWDRRWAGRALMAPGCRLALTFPASVPPAGPGPADCGAEVPGLLGPGAAFGVNVLVPGDVEAVACAAASGELAGVDPVVDDPGAAAELVGGFGDADLAFGGGGGRGGQCA